MIYYPVPLYEQEAFKNNSDETTFLPVTDYLCRGVLSLPMHTELDTKQLAYIAGCVTAFFEV